MSRLDDDREKLHEAVGFYRTRANLHGSSSDATLVRWAHQGGKGKPHADMVREKWHDFVQGRLAANLPVTDYQIQYAQAGLFEESPPSTDADAPQRSEDDGPAATIDDVGDRSGEDPAGPSSISESEPFCGHKVVTNDGAVVACDKCGEVLGQVVVDADGERVEWKDGHAYELESSRTEEPKPKRKRASKPKPKPEPPDEEVLF